MTTSKLHGIKLTPPIRALMFALFALGATAALGTTYWVDEKNGLDTNDGLSETTAFQTLAKAASKAQSSAHVIKVLPGVYSNGTMCTATTPTIETLSRVRLTGGVVMESTDGPEKTIIVGAPAPDASNPGGVDECGRGTNAVRCVYMQGNGTTLRGFTLTGGRTRGKDATSRVFENEHYMGAAVFGANSQTEVIENCIISNNFTDCATIKAVTAINCVFVNNAYVYGTSASYQSRLYGCVIVDGASGDCHGIRNCTFGTESTVGCAASYYDCANSIIMGKVSWHKNEMTFSNCVFKTGSSAYQQVNCKIVDDLFLDDDFRPIGGKSAAADCANPALIPAEIAATDRTLVPRRINGAPDVGALEGNWLDAYSSALARDSVRVTAASTEVLESTPFLISLTDGAMLSASWSGSGEVRKSQVTVEGEGTLTFSRADGVIETVTQVDGAKIVELGPADAESTFAFSFSGTGRADILRRVLAVTIAEDSTKPLEVVSGGIIGLNYLEPGQSVVFKPGEASTQYADGFTIGTEAYRFAIPAEPFVYTVPEDITGLEPVTIAPTTSNDRYVDAENGADGNNGVSPAMAKKTLAGAMKVTPAGKTLWALPGVYDEGIVTNNAGAHNQTLSRVELTSNVKLRSVKGPAETFIVGAAASGADADEYGRGTNAVRCVLMRQTDVKLIGFTITGGRTRGSDGVSRPHENVAYCGAGIGELNGTFPYVENCIVTNNFSYCAAVKGCYLVNCHIKDNVDVYKAAATHQCKHYGCLIEDGGVSSSPGVFNCTFLTGVNWTSQASGSGYYGMVNSYHFGTTGWHSSGSTLFTNCVLTVKPSYKCDSTTIVTNAENVAFDSEWRPVVRSNVGIDRANASYTPNWVSEFKTDVYGEQRIYNGAMDIGAVEADWRRQYAKDIAKREVVVSAADPQVVEREGKVTLDPGATLTAEWTPVGTSARCDVKASVTGTGTLTVSVDGAEIGTVTAADSPKTFNFGGAIDATSKIVFSYSQEEDDEGCAVIEKVGSQKGMLLLVR